MDDLIVSQDGSHTVFSKEFGVTYHSKYGAIQETQTVFIDAGLKFKAQRQSQLSILEMGFGTGLNALMTLIQTNPEHRINYHSIEAYPLNEAQYSQLNYPETLKLNEHLANAFTTMHSIESETAVQLSANFTFTKYIQKIETFTTNHKFDIIYYDAFAPTSQEELWTEEMMAKLFQMCKPGAVLVTYCAKGSFKRALRSAGFSVEALDGPIGKREMTRAQRPKLIGE